MIEVEIRARLNNFKNAEKKLKKLGAKFVESGVQIDRIYGNKKFLDSKNLIKEGGIVARIREVNGKKRLDFKEIRRRSGSGIELQCFVVDVRLAERLLNKLDFYRAFTIKKVRQKFIYKNFVISLDKVAQLGDFIEIEKNISTSNQKAKDQARKDCSDLLKTIVSNAILETKKYGDLIQEKINRRGQKK